LETLIILFIDYVYHFYRDYFVKKLDYSKREGIVFFEIIIFPAMITKTGDKLDLGNGKELVLVGSPQSTRELQ